jgi:hypothetical protein
MSEILTTHYAPVRVCKVEVRTYSDEGERQISAACNS